MKATNQRLCFRLLLLCESKWEPLVAKGVKKDDHSCAVRTLTPASLDSRRLQTQNQFATSSSEAGDSA